MLTLLTACSGEGSPPVRTEDAAPAATSLPPTTAATTTAAPAKASDVAKRYFEAMATDRPKPMEAMLEASAPDSVAFIYARFHIALKQARADQALEPQPHDVQVIGDSIRLCAPSNVRMAPGADPCATFGGFTVSPGSNLLDNFTVNGKPITDRLVRGGGTATAGGAKFTVVGGYQSVQSEVLNVAIEVTNGPRKISIYANDGVYIGANNRQVKASSSIAPTEVQPSASALIVVSFADALPGGRLFLRGYDGSSFEVVLPLS